MCQLSVDEQFPNQSSPLSKPVTSSRPPNTIENVLKVKDGASSGHMSHRSPVYLC